jgi:RHS repeat-associated protein
VRILSALRRPRTERTLAAAVAAAVTLAILPAAAITALAGHAAAQVGTPAKLTPSFNAPMSMPASAKVAGDPSAPVAPGRTWSTPYARFSQDLSGKVTAVLDGRPRFDATSSPAFNDTVTGPALIATATAAATSPDIAASRLGVGTAPSADGPSRSWLRFGLSQIPADAVIQGATLTLRPEGCIDTGMTLCAAATHAVELHRIDGNWDAGTDSASIFRMTAADALASASVAPGATATSWDVTRQVQEWVSGAAPNSGLSVQLADESAGQGGLAFAATGTEAPLTVVYTVPSTTLDLPTAPVALDVQSGGADGTRVTWAPGAGAAATSYLVNARDDSGRVVAAATVCGACLSANMTGLKPGASYSFEVRARGLSGMGPASTWSPGGADPAAGGAPVHLPVSLAAYVRTGSAPPPANSAALVNLSQLPPPENVSAVGGDHQAIVSWDPPSQLASVDNQIPTGYDIQMLTYPGGALAYENFAGSVTGRTHFLVQSLTPGQRFSFQIAAFYELPSIESAFVPSNAVTVGPIVTTPSAPSGVSLSAGNQQVTATWTAPSSNGGGTITGYTVTAYRSSGTYAGQVTVCGTCLSGTVTGLTNGLSYYVTVLATNSAGNGPTATSPTVTLAGPVTLVESVTSGTSYARGQVIGYSLTVSNSASNQVTVSTLTDRLTDVLPPAAGGDVTFDASPCTATTSPSCAWAGQTLSVSSFNVTGGGQHVLLYRGVAVGVDGGCEQTTDLVTATAAQGTSTTGLSPTVCGTGLGQQSWWSYVTKAIGPGSTAGVNAANGNLLVTAADSTPVPGEGAVVLGINRTYNGEDPGLVPLPGGFGSGWNFTYDAVSPSGLVVPSSETVTDPLGVTLVDRTGSRFVFGLQPLSSAVDVTGLSGASTMIATLQPRRLVLDSGYNRICVDEVAQGPAGVHLGLWRYVEAQTSSGTTPCAPSTWSASAVLGFGAERPDRQRFEFAWDGHQLDAVDSNGNEVAYRYSGTLGSHQALGNLTSVVEVSTNRAITFTYPTSSQMVVTDPAGRVTTYLLDTSGRLQTVQNPDSSSVTYAYGTCAGAGASQLCKATDPRGNSTNFTYALASSLYKVASMVERGGTSTTVTYGSNLVNFDSSGERTQVANFDVTGRATDTYQGDTGSAWLRHEKATWGTCSLGKDDNQLCELRRYSASTQAPDEDTVYTYNFEGRQLTARSVDSGSGSSFYTTSGYRAEYVERDGSVRVLNDAIAGAGAVTSDSTSGRADAGTIFYISDAVASLTPRGNAVAASGNAAYETTYLVDNNTTLNPNLAPAGSACTPGAGAASNTGDVCEIDAPGFDATHSTSVTRFTYTNFGAPATRTTAKSVAESGSTPPAYAYTYYGASDTDLSTHTSTAGWLKGITDPLGKFTAVAYDAAGDVTRSWDRDATAGLSLSSFPGTIASPASASYVETLRGTGAASYSAPWRYVRSSRDQLGDLISYTVDANGNSLTIRPPRGNQAGTSTYDTVQTFTLDDDLASSALPLEVAASKSTTHTYSRPGVETSQVDPNGNVTVSKRDAVNRVVAKVFTRDIWPSDTSTVPPSCRQSTSGDAPIPSGRILCQSTAAYDGVDDPIAVGDANGQTTTIYYDARHHETRRDVPRNDGITTLTTETAYDADGNVTDVCTPRQYSEGGSLVTGGCPSTPQYGTHKTYDVAGRLAASSIYRSGGGGTAITTYGYDGDGNQVKVTDANGTATTSVFDLLDRKSSTTVPRAAGVTNTTTWNHDPNGNVTAVVAPPSGTHNRVTASSYDAANRLIDTVVGADSVSAAAAGTLAANGGANVRTRNAYDADGHLVAVVQPPAFQTSVTSPDLRYLQRTDFDADGRKTAAYTARYGGSVADIAGDNSTQSTECPITGVMPQTVTGAPAYPAGTGICVERYAYDYVGNLTSTIFASATGNTTNRSTSTTYTDDNRPSVQSGAYSTFQTTMMTYFYDGVGRVSKAVDVLGIGYTRTYTADGLLKVQTDTPGIDCQCSHVTTNTYDANGNQITAVDPIGNTSQDVFYSDDTRKTHTDGAGDQTVYAYDQLGRTSSVKSPSATALDSTNPSGAPTTYTYTLDGLPLTVVQPVAKDGSVRRRTSYSYTAFGAKATEDRATISASNGLITDAGSQTSTYYDDGRLASLAGRGGAETQTFTYDGFGNILQAVDAASTLTADYYLDGHLKDYADGHITAAYAYNGNGSISRRNYTGLYSYSNDFTYNDDGWLSSMTQNNPDGTETTSWTYDRMGKPLFRTDANIRLEWSWDPGDRTLADLMVVHQADLATLSDKTFTYDKNRRITQSQVTSTVGGQTTVIQQDYWYDAANRLYQAFDGNTTTTTYTWDHDGNLLSNGQTTFVHNEDGSIASATTGGTQHSYTYSAAGAVTSNGCGTYTVDGFERVTQMAGSAGTGCPAAVTTQYSYDALNRQAQHYSSTDGEHVLDSFDGLTQAVLVEHKQTANQDFVYGVQSDGTVKTVTQYNSTSTTSMAHELLAGDQRGTLFASETAAGSNLCAVLYDPFGAPQSAQSATNPCWHGSTVDAFLYHSSRHDNSTGAYQFGARTYDPKSSSFLQQDSYLAGPSSADIGLGMNPATQNRFGYVNGDPVNRSDPSGHCSEYNSTGDMNACWAQSQADGSNHCDDACQQRNQDASAQKQQNDACDSACEARVNQTVVAHNQHASGGSHSGGGDGGGGSPPPPTINIQCTPGVPGWMACAGNNDPYLSTMSQGPGFLPSPDDSGLAILSIGTMGSGFQGMGAGSSYAMGALARDLRAGGSTGGRYLPQLAPYADELRFGAKWLGPAGIVGSVGLQAANHVPAGQIALNTGGSLGGAALGEGAAAFACGAGLATGPGDLAICPVAIFVAAVGGGVLGGWAGDRIWDRIQPR